MTAESFTPQVGGRSGCYGNKDMSAFGGHCVLLTSYKLN